MGVVNEARPIGFNIPHIYRLDFLSVRIVPDKDNLGDWEIRSICREFKASQGDHVVYEVGKSDWAQDWPRGQRTGSPYEVHFNLDAAPQGRYLLKISSLAGYMRTPDMQVEINGHKGVFYVRSKPLYTANNALLTIELPMEYMAKGENSLVLSPVHTQAAANAGSGARR